MTCTRRGGPALRRPPIRRVHAGARFSGRRAAACARYGPAGARSRWIIVPRAGQARQTREQTSLPSVASATAPRQVAVRGLGEERLRQGSRCDVGGCSRSRRGLFRYRCQEDSNRRKPYTREGRIIKGVRDRLRRTEADEELDNRSIESVGWMANELHHRIEAHYRDELRASTSVGVFRGWVTSEARKAAGIGGASS